MRRKIRPDDAKSFTKFLSDVLPKRKGRPGSVPPEDARVWSQVDIIGEKFCDDVVRYLAPTLEQHKGCTVIDFHPGTCLFSTKIHEFLKPRRHILVEPVKPYFDPFIKPLLDKPGSTYRYTDVGLQPMASWHTAKTIQDDPSLLPPRSPPSEGQAKLRELDSSTLIIGNLAREYAKVRNLMASNSSSRVEYAPHLLHQMSQNILMNLAFQNSGLVRMLWWMPEWYAIPTVLGGTVSISRSSFNVGLDLATKRAQVAAVKSCSQMMLERKASMARRTRFPELDHLVADQVADRMRQGGFTAPKDRDLLQMDPTGRKKKNEAPSSRVKSPFADMVDNPAALRAKIEAVTERMENLCSRLPSGYRTTNASLEEAEIISELMEGFSPEYPQTFLAVEHQVAYTLPCRIHRAVMFFDLELRVLNLEANFNHLQDNRLDKATADDFRNTILGLGKRLDQLVYNTSRNDDSYMRSLVADQIAAFSNPQLNMLDRRPFESLKADTTDFWPHTGLALIDMLPRSVDLSVPGLATHAQGARVCGGLLKNLFSSPSISVVNSLNRIAINAGTDLVPMVPAITDPRRGGRLDPQNVKVSMLTVEMIEGLVKASFEWPFRPESWELMLTGPTS